MIKIVEVGPRDGLQNEAQMVPANVKIDFINALSKTGVSEIEASAFVSSKKVPQLQDATQVFENLHRMKNVVYSALVPNERGLDRAIQAGVDKISVFTAASETFNQRNINTSIDGSLERFQPVIQRAVQLDLPVRGYLSTSFWCAFEGRIPAAKVVDLALRLFDMGISEVSISDTIGKATPDDVAELMDILIPKIPAERLAVHFHDTYGKGIANVLRSVSYGIQVVDASVGGLGGCPFAPGATGNISTQDVVTALTDAGEHLDVDLKGLDRARDILNPYLRQEPAHRPSPDSLACSTCEFFRNGKCCGRR